MTNLFYLHLKLKIFLRNKTNLRFASNKLLYLLNNANKFVVRMIISFKKIYIFINKESIEFLEEIFTFLKLQNFLKNFGLFIILM